MPWKTHRPIRQHRRDSGHAIGELQLTQRRDAILMSKWQRLVYQIHVDGFRSNAGRAISILMMAEQRAPREASGDNGFIIDLES